MSGFSPVHEKEVRKIIIFCILATDMAKHGEIMNKAKDYAPIFKVEDLSHRQCVYQLSCRCSKY